MKRSIPRAATSMSPLSSRLRRATLISLVPTPIRCATSPRRTSSSPSAASVAGQSTNDAAGSPAGGSAATATVGSPPVAVRVMVRGAVVDDEVKASASAVATPRRW